MSKGEYRFPWWGILVHRDLAGLTALLPPALRMVERPPTTESLELVPGASGWSGVVCYHRDEPHFALAGALRALAETDVLVLEWGDAPWIHRWDTQEQRWKHAERDISALGRQLGLQWPWPKAGPGRPHKYAALIEGVRFEDVVGHAKSKANVLVTSRGVVVLDEKRAAMEFAESPNAKIYSVTRYLDTNDFVVIVFSGGEAQVFGTDQIEGKAVHDVDGETEAQNILRKLSIPVEHFFPARDD